MKLYQQLIKTNLTRQQIFEYGIFRPFYIHLQHVDSTMTKHFHDGRESMNRRIEHWPRGFSFDHTVRYVGRICRWKKSAGPVVVRDAEVMHRKQLGKA